MSLLANIIGFSVVGLAARFGQLAIQKRNLFSNPGGHLISMGVFGYGGYWAYRWDQRAAELLAQKRLDILQARQKEVVRAEKAQAASLQE